MKPGKNSVTLILMISSIILLLTLEGFWLRSSYLEELNRLRRETNFLFRAAIFALQDSLIEKNIKPLKSDTGVVHVIGTRTARDSVRLVSHFRRQEFAGDVSPPIDNLEIYINAPAGIDSLRNVFYRPLVSQLKKNGEQRAFAIRIGTDSIKRSDVVKTFGKSLTEARISLPFKLLVHGVGYPPVAAKPTGFATDWIPTVSACNYRAVFGSVQLFLFGKIAPQILFSFFLSGLTVLSFAFMYRSIRSQQKLMDIKNDFISNISHELKTPIATVSVALEALKNFKGMENPKTTEEYLDIARFELGRLSILTDKVLTSSLLDARGMQFDFEKVDLEKVLNGILNSMSVVFQKQNAAISFQKSGNDFIVTGNSIHLSNVFYNLLDNALKYSFAPAVITVTLKDLEDQLSVEITDRGLGIPAEFRRKIFEKFFRVPTGDVHNVKGHGLGLNYVESVVTAHRGSIDVVSQLGEGSTFIIHLPKTQS